MSSQKKHILLIRLSSLGDVAMTIPVILSLKHLYPELKISVLTKPFYAQIFKGMQDIHVMTADVKNKHKGVRGLLKLSEEIRNEGITQVADFHNVLRTKILRLFFFIHGLKTKSIKKGRKDKKALIRTKKKIFKPLIKTIQRYAEVLLQLGYPIHLGKPLFLPKPEMQISLSQDIRYFTAQKHIGIAPFAAHDGKTYPADLMQEVIKNLSSNQNTNIYLFGGGKLELSRLQNWALPYKNVFCMPQKYTFREELSLIAHLDLMISMDSANGHLAAMYGVKVLTLWGQTHPYAGFAPFLQPKNYQILPDLQKYPLLPISIFGNKALKGYEEVMRSISPAMVVDKVNQILS